MTINGTVTCALPQRVLLSLAESPNINTSFLAASLAALGLIVPVSK